MERTIAVEVTNMTYNLLLLCQLSYLAIVAAYNGQSLQWKSNWVEFHIHRKKVYWEFVLIRWMIDGLIAGGGIEPPFRAKEARELPILHPASTRTSRVSNGFFVLCVPLSGHCFVRLFASTGNTRDDFLVIVVCSTKLIWILYTYVPYKDLHLLKTHHAKCALHQALPLRDTCWPENGICLGYAVSHLYGYRSKALNQQVFSICITDKWHSGKKWKFRDSNPRPTGYEPVALTNWAKFPE